MAAVVRRAVEAGDYSSNSEVIREALRDWAHKRTLREQSVAGLRTRWQESVADDSEGLEANSVFHNLEKKYKAMPEPKGR
jgi:antitoxin ParD1/3/4